MTIRIQAGRPKVIRAEPDLGPGASDLLPLVYRQRRALAQRGLESERNGHTLTATAP